MIRLSTVEHSEASPHINKIIVPNLEKKAGFDLKKFLTDQDWLNMMEEARKYSYGSNLIKARSRLLIISQATGRQLHTAMMQPDNFNDFFVFPTRIRMDIQSAVGILGALRQVYGSYIEEPNVIENLDGIVESVANLLTLYLKDWKHQPIYETIHLLANIDVAMPKSDGSHWRNMPIGLLTAATTVEWGYGAPEEFSKWANLRIFDPTIQVDPEVMSTAIDYLREYREAGSWTMVTNTLANLAIMKADQIHCTPNGLVLSVEESPSPLEQPVLPLPTRKQLP